MAQKPDSLPRLAITGSTGALGSLVARQLASAGIPLRLLVRTPDRAPKLDGCVALAVDYADVDVARRALEGVETLFMVSLHESPTRTQQHIAFVDAAAAAGVSHVVYTSFVGAAPDCAFTLGRDHWATEEHIKRSGMRYTFLRDNFYLDILPHFAGEEDGVIRGPAGEGRVAAVSRQDVARAAGAVLKAPQEHVGRTYDLTGPTAISFDQVAATLSERTGRTIRYHAETIEEAYASRQKWGAEPWQLDAWVSTYTTIAKGELERVSDDVERLTGHKPLSLRDLVLQ